MSDDFRDYYAGKLVKAVSLKKENEFTKLKYLSAESRFVDMFSNLNLEQEIKIGGPKETVYHDYQNNIVIQEKFFTNSEQTTEVINGVTVHNKCYYLLKTILDKYVFYDLVNNTRNNQLIYRNSRSHQNIGVKSQIVDAYHSTIKMQLYMIYSKVDNSGNIVVNPTTHENYYEQKFLQQKIVTFDQPTEGQIVIIEEVREGS